MNDCDLSPIHLSSATLAAQLARGLDDVKQPTCGTGVRVGKHSAVCVDRKRAAETGLAILEESSSLAPLHEAEFLELDDRCDREAVVEHGELGIKRTNSGHVIGDSTRLGCASVRQAVGHRNMLM